MKVSDIMTTNVVTIPSNTSLAEARRLKDAHQLSRMPVVDKSKLVDIVTKDALDGSGPSELTTFSMHEVSFLLHKIKVRDVMRKNVITGSPDMTVEQAVALAQSKGIGSVVVTEDAKVVGIMTTNDVFIRSLTQS